MKKKYYNLDIFYNSLININQKKKRVKNERQY